MVADNDLFQELSGDKADQSELEQVFLAHFGRATGLDEETITYGGQREQCALILKYADGSLTRIVPGPLLTQEDVPALKQKIHEELLTPGPVKIGRQVLFTALPVEGSFRYKDVFQIAPVPPDAPRPPYLIGDHPFMLEWRFPASSNGVIHILRRTILERELELLLNALLWLPVRGAGSRARFHWVLPPMEDPTKPTSAFLQETYAWPGLALEGDEFLETSHHPLLAEVSPNDYYARHGISIGEVLDIPAGLPAMLDHFFALAREDRDRVLRASYWFQYASRASDYSRSAAYMALVSAVESLMPSTEGRSRCETCGQFMGPGPTKMFINFVEQFATGSSISKADRGRFYAVRSAITHGARLLHSDRSAWGGSFTPVSLREQNDMTMMWRIVRATIVNWLASRKV